MLNKEGSIITINRDAAINFLIFLIWLNILCCAKLLFSEEFYIKDLVFFLKKPINKTNTKNVTKKLQIKETADSLNANIENITSKIKLKALMNKVVNK